MHDARRLRRRAGETLRFEIVRNGRLESHGLVLGSYPRETLPGVVFEYGAVALNDGSPLRTIVSVPTGDGVRRPAVVLIQGGGRGSIDTPLTPDFAQPGLMRTLAQLGYVTLRVEKSGVGDSRGSSCEEIGYTQELNGYRAALAALAALKRHRSVDAARVVLLGISLGGFFAPILANGTPVLAIAAWGTHVELPSLDHCWTRDESMEDSRGHRRSFPGHALTVAPCRRPINRAKCDP